MKHKSFAMFSLIALCLALCAPAKGQNSITMTQGTRTVNLCSEGTSGVIYDNGGPSGDYSNSFDGYVVLQAASGISITLAGSYNTESGYDRIYVYDGFSNGGTLLGQFEGSGTLNVTATSGTMTVYFHTDGSVTRSGFALSYSADGAGGLCNNVPSGLTAANVTSRAADLGWDASGPGTFMVKLSSNLGVQRYFTTQTSLALSGLHPNTQYRAQVVDVRDSNSLCCSVGTTFRTLCGPSPLPIVEDFEGCGSGSSDAFPLCWSRVKNYDNSQYPYVETYSNERVMHMYCGPNDYHWSILILPEADVEDLSQCFLRFRAYPESYYTKLEVGVCDDTTLMGHGFTPVDTIDIGSTSGSWHEYIVPLAGYTGSGRFVAIRFSRDLQSYSGTYVRIDDVVLNTCGIQSVSQSHATHNSMRINFSIFGSPTINLEYGPQGFAPGTGTTVQDITSPYTVEGLTPNTAYTFRLIPSCGDDLFLQGQRSVNGSTLALRDTVAPLCDDFTTNTIGSLWLRRGGSSYRETANDVDHYHRAFSSYTTGYSTTAYLVSPRLADSLHNLSVGFWAKDWYDYTNRTIQIATTRYPEQESEYHYVGSVTVQGNAWRYYQVALTGAPAGDDYIVIRTNASSTYLLIDEIAIAPCLPRDVRIYGVTDHEATITWQGAESVRVQWGDTTVTATSSPFTFGGLPADSTLTLYVQGDCEGAGCPEPFTITTLEAPLGVPYCQEFESTPAGQLPDRWIAPYLYDGCPQVYNNSNYAYQSNRSLRMYSYRSNSSSPVISNYAVMPLLDEADLTSLYVSFRDCIKDYYSSSSAYYGVIEVGVMDNPYDTSTFVPVATYSHASANNWYTRHASLSNYTGTGRYLAFRYRMTYNGYCYARCQIDHIRVSHSYVANSTTVQNTTDTSITVNWRTVPANTTVRIQLGDTTVFVDNDSSYTFRGLTPETSYTCYITTEDGEYCTYDNMHIRSTFGAVPQLPYCNDFNAYSNNSSPSDWLKVVNYGDYPRLWNNSSMTVDFGAANGQNIYALPAFAGDLRDAIIQFRYRHYHDNTMLIVGVMDIPQESYTNTFTPIDTLDFTGQSNYQFYDFTVSLASYTGTGRHIAFRFVSTSSSMRNGWLDDLRIFTCALTDPRVYNITNNSATVSWEGYPDSVAGEVWIEYGPRNFALGDSSSLRVLATTNPFSITGLDEDTDYDFVFVSDCGGGSCSHPRVQIHTMSFASQPTLCYTFETEASNTMPEGWSRPVVYGSYPRVWNNPPAAYRGNNYLDFQACSNNYNIVASPLLQVDDMRDLYVSFQYRFSVSNGNFRMVVGVMDDPADLNSFVGIDTIVQNGTVDVYRYYSQRLSSYTGSGRYLAFKYYTTNTGCSYFLIDNLTLSLCRIDDVHFYNPTTHSIDVSWAYPDADYAGDGVIIEYDTLPFAYGTGTRVVSSASPFTLDSLEAGRQYYIYVVPHCDNSVDCATEYYTYSTKEQDLLPPFCQDFYGQPNGSFPSDWYRPLTYNGTPQVTTSSSHTASASLQLSAVAGWPSMAVVPALDVDALGSLYLSFWTYMPQDDCLLVGAMENPYDTSTFVLIDSMQLTGHSRWEQQVLSLASYTGTGRYVSFRFSTASTSARSVYIDDISLRDCQIANPRVHHVSQTSAEVSWDNVGMPYGVWVEYAPVGGPTGDFAPGYGTRVFFQGVTDGIIHNLTAATYYAFHFWVQCDTTQDECSYTYINAQTLHPFIAFPSCEDFEECANNQNTIMNNWRRLSTYSGSTPYVCSVDDNNVLRFDAQAGRYSIAIMPGMEVTDECSSVSGKTVRFRAFSHCNPADSGYFEVGVMEDVYDASTFVPVDTVQGLYNQWTAHFVSLERYQGTGSYIAFRYSTLQNAPNYFLVDNLCVEPCVVADIRVSSVEQNQVTITWTGVGNPTVECEYGPAGFQRGEGTVVRLTSSPAQIGGLDASTSYQFYFNSVCACETSGSVHGYNPSGSGNGGYSWIWCDSCWWNWGWGWGGGWGGWGGGGWGGGIGTTVITPPDPVTLPYCDDFEDYSANNFPRSWSRVHGSNTLYPRVSTSRYHSKNNSMEFYSVPSSDEHTRSFAVLPPQGPIDVSQVVLKFWAMVNNNAGTQPDAGFFVGVMTDPMDTSSFVSVARVVMGAANRWEEKVVDFSAYSGTGRYIAFKYAPRGEAYNTYVDDIYLGYCAVSNVRYSNATGSSVDVSWTGHNSPSQVTVTYGEQGFDPEIGEGTTVVCTSNPFTIVGLDNGQNYDFYLSALCGDGNMPCFTPPFTLNPSIVAPYCENFDGIINGQLPDNWMRRQANGSNVRVEDGVLRMNPSSGAANRRFAILPPMRGDSVRNMTVSFRSKVNSTSYAQISVGVISDTNDLSSFQEIATVSHSSNNAWKQQTVSLANYTGTGDRIVIVASSSSSSRECYVDDLVINHFAVPTGISVHHLSSERVLIVWNHDDNRTQEYTVEFGRVGFGTGTQVLAHGDSVVLTGLRPGTQYEYFFRMGSSKNDCQRFQFTTQSQIPLPYCEDFENYTDGTMPDGWTKFGNCSNWYSTVMPTVCGHIPYGGSRYCMEIRFSSSSGQYAYAVMPEFDVADMSSLNFSMMVYCEGYPTQKKLIFGVMEDRNDMNSFVPCDTLLFSSGDNNTWVRRTASLRNYMGTGRYPAFQYVATTSSNGFSIDNLKVESFPHPTISAGPDNNVILNVPGVDSVDYYIEYGRLGFMLGHGTQVHITTNPATIEGLETGATYDFYALASPTGSTCYDPVHIVAQELPRTPLPYCENFDQLTDWYRLPEGWSRITNSGYYPGSYANYYHTSAPYAIRFDANEQVVVLPPLGVDSLKRLSLEMRLCSQSYRDNARRFVVGVMDSKTDVSTFVGVDTLWFDPENTHVEHIYGRTTFSNYQGNGRFIAIKYLCNGSDWLHMDNLIIDLCPAPTVEFHNYNTVKVTSPMPNPDYYIEYGPSTNERDSNLLVHITSSPFYLTDLLPNTTYRFWPQCDSCIASSCYGYTEIRTNAQFSVPYCEDFESLSNYGFPSDWIKHPSDNNNDYLRATTSGYANASNHGMEFYNCANTNYASNGFAVLPEFDIDSVKRLTISMDIRPQGNGYFEVGVMTDPNNRYTYTPVAQLTTPNTNNWNRSKVSLSSYGGDGKFIAIRYNHLSSCGWGYIDNVVVEECDIPNNARVYLFGHNIVHTYWDDTTSTDAWLEYGEEGFVQGTGTFVHVTDRFTVIDGLDDLTNYQFYYRCDTVTNTCRPAINLQTSTMLELPLCEDFESYATYSLPTNWKKHPTENYNDYVRVTTSSYANNSSHGVEFYNSASTNYWYNGFLVLPDLDIDSINRLSLSLDIRPYSGYFEVGVMTDPNNRYSYTPVAILSTPNGNNWFRSKVSLASYTGVGKFIAIRYNHISSSGWGYIDNLSIEACHTPNNFRANTVSHNQIELSWDTTIATDDFYVEYGPHGFAPGSGVFIHSLTNPTLLTLDNNTTYDFYVRCDTLNGPCEAPVSATTGIAPIAVPSCIDFEEFTSSQLPEGWLSYYNGNDGGSYAQGYVTNSGHSGGKSLYLFKRYGCNEFVVLPDIDIDSMANLNVSFWAKSTQRDGYLLVGIMEHANDVGSFVTVKQIAFNDGNYHHYNVSLRNYHGSGRYLCFCVTGTSSSYSYPINAYIDDIYLSTCGATDFAVQDITDQSVTFTWNQTGQPDLSIEYGPQGFAAGTGTTVHPTSSPYTIANLIPLTNYTFRISSDCDDMGTYCSADESKVFNIFTPVGGMGCVDYTDLTDANVTCTYGSYSNPYANIGIIDNGYAESSSRHTVHYDTTATDPRTGNLLGVVPPGSDASVRLGNWLTNAEAESITYGLAVDTNDFDLLILKYAAVLQDPAHGASHQPRFRIQILDSAMNLIDADCGAADFIANRNLGWNLAANNVLWKDWTTVGLDLAPYAGQRVYVRLTTFDCGESTHYGYAYFTLNCMRKSMQASGCGYVAENTFTAPSGFAYRWYSSANLDTTLSTSQSITVESNNDITYFCDASFVDNDNCYFTLAAFAGTRFPLADFSYSYTVEDCQFKVQFQNLSTVSMDGVNPLGTGEACETALWDFGNGLTSTAYHGYTTYSSPGTYDVTLYSGLAGDACIDSLTLSLTLAFDITPPSISGTDEVCQGDTVTLSVDHAYSLSGWGHQATTAATTFVADTSSVLLAFVVDSSGCTDTLRHSLLVHPLQLVADSQSVCQDALPFRWIDDEDYSTNQSGSPVVVYPDRFGCDSTVALYLTIHALTSSDTVLTACDSYLWNGITCDSAGDYTYSTLNAAGCDSLATLHLTVNATTASTTDSVVCDSLFWNGETYLTSGTFGFVTTNAAGCDSTATLNLTVHLSTVSTSDSVACDSLLWNGVTYTSSGSYFYGTDNAVGCDSTATLNLTVRLSTVSTTASVACDSLLWNGMTYTTSGSYDFVTSNVAGCDSTATLNLTVNLSTESAADSVVCDSLVWNGTTYTSSGTYAYSATNAAQCDSTAVLHLTVNRSTSSEVEETIVENELPYTYLGSTFTEAGAYTITIANAAGCDSVISYTLHVSENTSATADSTVCFSVLPLEWNGYTFTADSSSQPQTLRATVTLLAESGADSVLTMRLTVNPVHDEHFHQTICDNEDYTFADSIYSEPGVYSHSLTNQYGCDSLATLHLTVNATTASTTDSVVCDSLFWNGETYLTSGTFDFVTTNAVGCDSTATLNLTVHLSTVSTSDSVACDSLLWNGVTYTSSGSYFYGTDNAVGCDSTATLNLTVRLSTASETDSVACDSLLWNGMTYTTSGSYDFVTSNVAGCDSTATLNLTVNLSTESAADSAVCDSLVWNGTTYTSSGTYAYSATNAAQCDSTAVLHLTVNRSTSSEVEETIVENELPYTYLGSTFTEAGTYTITIANAAGCDSVISYTLHVSENTSATADSTVCFSALPLEWNGYTFTADSSSQPQTLRATVTLLAESGADSVLTMRLTVSPVHDEHYYQTICDNEDYTFADSTYSEPGVYAHGLTNQYGCDSLATLHLTVNATTASTTDSVVCDSLFWNGEAYLTSGTFDYVTTNAAGCDSTATLNLTVHLSTVSTSDSVACDSLLWNGLTYTSSGSYFYGTDNAVGCDSTATLNLTVRLSTVSTTDSVACDSLLWNGMTYTTSGSYGFVTSNVAGCDSTATLNLTVNLSTESTADSAVCDSLVWNGTTYTSSGTYAYSATNAAQCDSTAVLHLTVNRSTTSEVEETIVENELPYTYLGSTFTEAGTYTITIANAAGCDSVISYTLHVSENTSATADSTVCFSALPLEWNGYTFTADSSSQPQTLRATVTLLAESGADSVLTMRLTVNPVHDEHFHQTICDNEDYTFADSIYSEPGVYAHSLTNQYGCDSLATLHLTVNATTASTTDSVVCDSLFWNGETYRASGTYTFSSQNALSCDSTAVLNLTVNSSSSFEIWDTIVENSLPHTFLSETFTASSSASLRLVNAAGCDSVIGYSLHVWPNQSLLVDSMVCDDALPLLWNDSLFAEAGQKTTLFLDSHGADSLVTLSLTVHPTYDLHAYDTICEGGTRPFGGNEYGSSGDFAFSYSSIHSCDSLSTLHLVVHAATFDTIRDTILENQLPYTFNGHLCLDSGFFSITIPNAMGCDSNIAYHLFVHRNVSTMLDSAVCDDLLPLVWDDALFTADTLTRTKHLLDRHGADSTVVMRLTVYPTYDLSYTRSLCTNELPFSWEGFAYDADPDTLPYTHDELLSLRLQTAQGCDSVASLALTVRKTSSSATSQTACDSFTWEGSTCTLSGTYTVTLSNALECDSLATLELTLYRGDTAEVEAVSCGAYEWNGQELSATGDYEYQTLTTQGCDSLCVLHLRVPILASEMEAQACDSLRWNGELYTLGGDYMQRFTSADGCDSVVTLHLDLHPSSEHDEQATLCEGDLPYSYNDLTFPYGTPAGMQEILYTDRFGCDSLIHLMLDIHYNPLLAVQLADVLCSERRFELAASHTDEVAHVFWTATPDDPELEPQRENDLVSVAPSRTTVYTATATVPGTPCSNSLSLTVEPFPTLQASMEIAPPFATPTATELTLLDRSRGQIDGRLWEANGDYAGDLVRQPYTYPVEEDSVEVLLIVRENRFGCLDTARTVVRLRGGSLFAPNAFTPGADDNNRFRLFGRNIVHFELDIYSRAGQLVFHADEPDEEWDGTHNGAPCPQASYVYIVRYSTTEAPREIHVKKGTVTLLR